MVTTAMIKQLKEASGAGILDCKRALDAANGDVRLAADALREQGLARATRKAGRETGAGLVVVQEAAGAVCAVELDCETDFAAGSDAFRSLTHRIADQVLAGADLVDAAQLSAAEFIDAPGKSTAVVIQELVGKLGENVALRAVARYANDGASLVEGYIHGGDVEAGYGPTEGRIGVLIELGLGAAVDEQAARGLARDLALHITAANPLYLSPDELPTEDQGRAQELCLLSQPYVKNDSLTVEQHLREQGGAVGGAVTVRRFARFEVGS